MKQPENNKIQGKKKEKQRKKDKLRPKEKEERKSETWWDSGSNQREER